MKSGKAAIAAIVVLATAAVVRGVVAAAPDGTPIGRVQAAIDSHEVAIDNADVEKASYIEPFSDVGDAADVDGIKSVIPILVAVDGSVGRLPQDMTARHATITSSAAAQARAALVDEVWAPEVAADKKAEWELALPIAERDSYRPYDDNIFLVDGWSGIRISGDTAFALVSAHEKYSAAGETIATDPSRQYQINLVRGGKYGWQLSKVVRVGVGG